MRKPPVKWRQEWDVLLGKKPDPVLARELGVCVEAIANHRNAAGLKPFPGKQEVTCKCGRKVMRYRVSKNPQCSKCRKKQTAAWHLKNQEQHNRQMRDRYANNPDPIREKVAAWQKENREKVREYQARYRRNERRRNDEVIDSLPCLDCGMLHSDERRASILRRLLPMTVHEIREAWSCIWGPADEQGTAGEARIYRDLRALGAVRVSGTWFLRQDAKVAA